MKSTTQVVLFLLLLVGLAQNQVVQAENALPSQVTFAEHIAPLVHSKCASCHRPGQPGPFDLLTFEDVVEHSATIEAVIDDGYMPPWKASSPDVKYLHDRRLSEYQKNLLRKWNSTGNELGNASQIPPPPEFPNDWQLGEPDLVVEMMGSFDVPASGPDVYRSFVFPVALPEDRWIKAIEIKTQAQSTLHHALFFADPSGQARQQDGADGRAGIQGMNFLFRGLRQDRSGRSPKRNQLGLGGYVPGTTPAKLPGDLARPLFAGSDIVMQTHFHPSGKPETEHAKLAIYFADKAPSRLITPVQLPAMFGRFAGIDIPAGEEQYVLRDEFELPVDSLAIGISGHAHYIGKTMTFSAELPDGRTLMLMDIDDWDLDWQDNYYFDGNVLLPAGTKLKSTITYDNSEENPENPFSPPRRIRFGRESTDEMGSITLSVVPQDAADQTRLDSSVRRHATAAIAKNISGSWNFGTSRKASRLGDAISRLDTNRDGLLQKSELPERFSRLTGLFDRLDKNHDSQLDQEELDANLSFLQNLLRNRGR